jgi:hypothetical protein
MIPLLLFAIFSLCAHPKQSIQWNNSIGKYYVTPTRICYIRIINNQIERWYKDGERYSVTLETSKFHELPLRKSSKDAKKEFKYIEQKFNTHYIPMSHIKKMLR